MQKTQKALQIGKTLKELSDEAAKYLDIRLDREVAPRHAPFIDDLETTVRVFVEFWYRGAHYPVKVTWDCCNKAYEIDKCSLKKTVVLTLLSAYYNVNFPQLLHAKKRFETLNEVDALLLYELASLAKFYLYELVKEHPDLSPTELALRVHDLAVKDIERKSKNLIHHVLRETADYAVHVKEVLNDRD